MTPEGAWRCGCSEEWRPCVANKDAMRRSKIQHADAEPVRRGRTLRVVAPDDLAEVVRLVRGRACDLRSVALDDQGGNLHVPVSERAAPSVHFGPASRPGPRRGGGGELVVRRVVEFSLEGSEAIRWFDLDGLVYDDHTRRLAIVSNGALRLILTVERLDLALSLRDAEATTATNLH